MEILLKDQSFEINLVLTLMEKIASLQVPIVRYLAQDRYYSKMIYPSCLGKRNQPFYEGSYLRPLLQLIDSNNLDFALQQPITLLQTH